MLDITQKSELNADLCSSKKKKCSVVELQKQDLLGLQPPSVSIWPYEMAQEDDTGKQLNVGVGGDGRRLKDSWLQAAETSQD